MKTRIQKVGGDYGKDDLAVWRGELPLLQGAKGMHVALVRDDEDETVDVYVVSQVTLEILAATGDSEQVVYVIELERKSAPQPLMG